jgi:hypothetical protein
VRELKKTFFCHHGEPFPTLGVFLVDQMHGSTIFIVPVTLNRFADPFAQTGTHTRGEIKMRRVASSVVNAGGGYPTGPSFHSQ